MTINFRPFEPDDQLAAQLMTNRSGKFTSAQKVTVVTAALITGGALFVMSLMLIAFLGATFAGIGTEGVIGWLFLVVFLITFGYLGVTLFVNARVFVPDALARNPVKQARGKLKIRMPERERPELPFSYIVGDYSFAPYMVPAEVPMDTGREYIVYYAAHSRLFLSIEPAE